MGEVNDYDPALDADMLLWLWHSELSENFVLHKGFSYDVLQLWDTSNKAITSVLNWEKYSEDSFPVLNNWFQEVKMPFGFWFREFYKNCMYIFSWLQPSYSSEKRDDIFLIENLGIWISKIKDQLPKVYPSRRVALEEFWEWSAQYLSVLKLRVWFDMLESSMQSLEGKINQLLLSKIIWDHPRMQEYNFWKEFEWVKKDIRALETILDELKIEYSLVSDMNTIVAN